MKMISRLAIPVIAGAWLSAGVGGFQAIAAESDNNFAAESGIAKVELQPGHHPGPRPTPGPHRPIPSRPGAHPHPIPGSRPGAHPYPGPRPGAHPYPIPHRWPYPGPHFPAPNPIPFPSPYPWPTRYPVPVPHPAPLPPPRPYPVPRPTPAPAPVIDRSLATTWQSWTNSAGFIAVESFSLDGNLLERIWQGQNLYFDATISVRTNSSWVPARMNQKIMRLSIDQGQTAKVGDLRRCIYAPSQESGRNLMTIQCTAWGSSDDFPTAFDDSSVKFFVQPPRS